MDIHIKNNVTTLQDIDDITFKKMAFFYNAIEEGWQIRKIKGDKYIFSKQHEGKKEVYLNSYLTDFIKSNMDLDKLAARQNDT